jgi:predicted restriction endonuclease
MFRLDGEFQHCAHELVGLTDPGGAQPAALESHGTAHRQACDPHLQIVKADIPQRHRPTITHSQIIASGHTTRQVSVRIGQPAFRAELVRKYGAVCAFSGPAPAEALEACHLYSYAEVGRHDIEGGLLLRRDLHRLFDQGLLAITADGTIDVGDSLQPYDLYFTLHGQQLKVGTTVRQREWLALHWDEWR